MSVPQSPYPPTKRTGHRHEPTLAEAPLPGGDPRMPSSAKGKTSTSAGDPDACLAALILSGVLFFFLLTACSGNDQPAEIHLGPESIQTVEVDSPTVLYRIGDREGPGMLEQGEALMMSPVPAGGFLVYSFYYSVDGPIQHFRGGELVRTLGRGGGGPGEYSRVSGLTVDPRSGDVWVYDGGAGRLVSFKSDGTPGPIVSTSNAGVFVRQPTVLPDGTLLLNGPGGLTRNSGFLLHRYDPQTNSWSAHHPVLRDSAFSAAVDRRWMRELALTTEGKVVAVSEDYVIEVLDPARNFALEEVVLRRPRSWPEDVATDNRRRRSEDPIAPRFRVMDAWIDSSNMLWVVAGMPEDDWELEVGPDPRRPYVERSLASSDDLGMDTLVEVIDVSRMEVIASFQIDPLTRFIVGPGMLAHYAGDLPFPQIEILKVTLN